MIFIILWPFIFFIIWLCAAIWCLTSLIHSAAPQENGSHHLSDALHAHNTLALQQTGMPKKKRKSLLFYFPVWPSLFTFYIWLSEEACIELTRAIEAGDIKSASVFASKLAGQHVSLKILPTADKYEDAEIRLECVLSFYAFFWHCVLLCFDGLLIVNSLVVVVEDSSSSCCITVKVFPHMTTESLKQQVHFRHLCPCLIIFLYSKCWCVFHLFQMFLEYGFHPRVQRWVIGQCLCTDKRSLASYGIRQDGDTAFLYLLSARHARLTLQALQQDQESALLRSPPLSFQNPQLPVASTNGLSSRDRASFSTLPSRLRSSSKTGKSDIGKASLSFTKKLQLLDW